MTLCDDVTCGTELDELAEMHQKQDLTQDWQVLTGPDTDAARDQAIAFGHAGGTNPAIVERLRLATHKLAEERRPPGQRAWRETLDELMRGAWREIRLRNSYAPEKFTPALYQRRSRSADYDGRLLRRRPCARVEERR